MNGFNEKINILMKTGRLRKAVISISALISIVIVVAVAVVLSRPAISLTGAEVIDGFDKNTAIDLNGKISSPVVSDATAKDEDTVTATVEFKYNLTSDNTVSNSTENKYVYLMLADDVKALEDGRSGVVTDEAYTSYLQENNIYEEGKDASGDYYISDDGTIVIKFRDEYLDWLATRGTGSSSGTGVTGGTFTLTADFKRGTDKGSTTYDFDIGGATVTVPGFTQQGMGLEKKGVDNGDGTATWTVTIYNPNFGDYWSQDKITQEGSWFVDPMLKDATDISVKGYGDTDHADSTIYNPTVIGDNHDTLGIYNTFPTFSTQGKQSYYPYYEITYKTPFTYENGVYDEGQKGYVTSVNNEATFHANNKDMTKNANITHLSNISVDKGTPSYDYNNNTISWEISLKNNDKLNLNGMKVKDNAFADIASGTSITVTGTDGYQINGDTITFTGDYTGDVKITYTVPATEGNGTNEVIVKDKSDNTIGYDNKWFSYDNIYAQKSGSVNKTDKMINWLIHFSTKGDNLTGYEVSDEMFKYASDIVACTGWDGESVNITVDSASNKVTIGDTTAKEITIRYSTPVADGNNLYGGVEVGEDTYEYKNTAVVGKDNNSETVEYTVTDTEKNEVTKNGSEIKYNDDYTQASVTWVVELVQNPGSYAGQTIDDVISLPDGMTVKDGLGSLSFKLDFSDEKYQMISLTAGSDYEIIFDEAAGKFSLSFKSTDDIEKLYRVRIEYNMTVNVDTDKVVAGVNYDIINKVSYNGKNPEAKVIYFRPDFENAPFNKTLNGMTDTVIEGAELEAYRQTIDGTDYYRFDYKINITDESSRLVEQQVGNGSYYVFEDYLPDKFTLTTGSAITLSLNQWYSYELSRIYDNSSIYNEGYYYDEAANKLTVYVSKRSFEYFSYSAMIKCSELDSRLENGVYNAVNTVKHDKYSEVSHNLKVNPGVKKDDGVLSKGGRQNGTGYYQYTVDINKDGLSLVPAGETLTVVDTMICEQYETGTGKGSNPTIDKVSGGTNNEFSPEISFFKIYKLNPDDTLGEEIKGWNYTFKNNPYIDHDYGEYSLTPIVNSLGWNETGLEIKVNPSVNYTFKVYAKDKSSNEAFSYEFYNPVTNEWNYGRQTVNFVNGIYEGSFTPHDTVSTDSVHRMLFYDKCFDNIESVEISDGTNTWGVNYREYTALAKLTITGLPDATPLRIVYTYSAKDSEHEYSKATVTNSVNLIGSGYGDDYSGYFLVSEKSGATSTGEQYLSLEKVDVGDFELTLTAGFYLSKYENGMWIPAKSISKPDNDENANFYVVTWGNEGEDSVELVKENNKTLNLQLAEKVLYKIVENREPDAFTNRDEYFGRDEGYTTEFYFSFMKKPDQMPEDVTECKVISSGSKYYIQNVRKVDVTVEKNWVGLPSNIANSVMAEFELYRTTDLSLTAADLEPLRMSELVAAGCIDSQYVNLATNSLVLTAAGNRCVFGNLPNGEDENGQAYYYFVKEKRYSLDNGATWVNIDNDAEYQPFYSGNFTNGDSTINVTNSSGLTVRKIWKDKNGNIVTDTSSKPAISFELYRIEKPVGEVDESLIYLPENMVGEYELNNANGYAVSVNCSELPGYTDSKNYLYYAKEKTVLADYQVTYSKFDNEGNLIIEIVNTATKEDISVVLPDTGGSGTGLFIILGATLMIAAAVMLAFKKKITE